MNLFIKLDAKDKHTRCNYCNYGFGCNSETWLRHAQWFVSFNYGQLIKSVRRFIYNLGALDYSKIDDIEIDGIDRGDYPDFCDVYINYATYKGKPMTDAQLDRLNNDSQFVYECVIQKIY